MMGNERLACCALLCVWTLGCYAGFDELEASCKAPLSTGDVRISEILANPRGPDGQQEYIELFNATAAELDLSGAVLVTSRQDGSGERGHMIGELSLSPGAYVVLGNAEQEAGGQLDYSYGSALGNLRNSDARVALLCGTTIVDETEYASAAEGYALELDGSTEPVAERDETPARWCVSIDSHGEAAGNFGTPGEANRSCPVVLQEGTCIDEGKVRSIMVPTRGQLRISEWMANPASVSDTEGEWIEVTALSDVDLNGLRLGDSSSSETLIAQDLCLPMRAGESFLFARNLDQSSNGGLGGAALEFEFALNNADETLHLMHGENQIDLVSYQSSAPGASTQVDARGNVCVSQSVYGDGDLGSPGELNPACP